MNIVCFDLKQMKVHVWTSLIVHPIAILIGFNSFLLKPPLDEDYDAILADPNMNGYYMKSPTDAIAGEAGVDKGF